jgi:hypothetical protein
MARKSCRKNLKIEFDLAVASTQPVTIRLDRDCEKIKHIAMTLRILGKPDITLRESVDSMLLISHPNMPLFVV